MLVSQRLWFQVFLAPRILKNLGVLRYKLVIRRSWRLFLRDIASKITLLPKNLECQWLVHAANIQHESLFDKTIERTCL